MRKLALITGASSGIGAEFAKQLATRNYDLVLVARRQERLNELAGSLQQSYGITAETLQADLASEPGLAAVEQRIAPSENLDLLVNNAGFGTLGYFHRLDVSSQDEMHRLHVLATLRLAHAALPRMIARKSGGIINVSSVAGFWQSPGSVSYCATKHWMNSFTKGLALELRAIGSPVKVQALCPGFTLSEFHDVARMDRNLVPKAWWMTAEQVVSESLQGLEQGRELVVPGLRYRLVVFFMQRLPQSLVVRVALRQRRGLREESQ